MNAAGCDSYVFLPPSFILGGLAVSVSAWAWRACLNGPLTPSLSFPLGCEDRETGGHPTTCSPSSPSSVDAHLQFPDSSGLLQAPRWDEPQRARALEQICGVFRVDLGHMRSLRLFFR